MGTVSVIAHFDLDCEWEGLPPVYRVYVGEEMFAERTWIWTEHYLSEMLQIQAEPGRYPVRIESVGPDLSTFKITNRRVEYGPARWDEKTSTLEIAHESP